MRSGWILTKIPHYQFFISLLISLLLTKSRLSSHQAALPFPAIGCPSLGLDAQVWAGLAFRPLERKSSCSAAEIESPAHACEYETVGKMLWGYAPSALPLEISDRWFHPLSFLISSSCFCWLVKACRANLVMVGTQSSRTSHDGVGVTSSSFQIQNVACSWNWNRLICRASASTAPSWFRWNSRIRWGQMTAAAAQMINFSIPCGKNLERQFWKFIVRQLVNWA